MKRIVSKIPLPVTLLLFALVVLSEILNTKIEFLGDLTMVMSIVMAIIVLVKLVLDFRTCISDLNSAVGISLFAGFNMSLMFIAEWLGGILGKLNIYVWMAGVVLQTLIMIIFFMKYIMNFKLKYIFPSVYLVYAGMGVSVITCKSFGMIVYGKAMFMMVIAFTIALTPFVIVRIIKRPLTDAARPLISLLSVPVSVILVSYITVSSHIVISRLWFLFVLVQIAFLITVVLQIASVIEGYFSSWSSYSLSSVIAAYATYRFDGYMSAHKMGSSFVEYLLYVEYFLAILICLVVFITYLINIFEEPAYHKRKVEEFDNKRITKRKSKAKLVKDDSVDKKVEKMEKGNLPEDSESVSEKVLPKVKKARRLTPEQIAQNTQEIKVLIEEDDDLLG